MTTDSARQPIVTVVIPCRNEAGFIGRCLDSITAGDYPAERLEIVIADGMSSDGTRQFLDGYVASHQSSPAVRVIDNPEGFVSHGLNRAILEARGEIIVRMDAHTEYAADYISRCVETLERTGAANVGGPIRTRSEGWMQTAISLAFHSPFCAGGARSRDVHHDGPVDTVAYGCWRRETLLAIGLFDEELVRNQDDELNLRLSRAGCRIHQSTAIVSWYRPRSSPTALFRQQLQYGYWKVRVIRKHRLPASWRHLVPAAWVASLGLLTPLAAIDSPIAALAGPLLTAELALYGSATLLATLAATASSRKLCYAPALPLLFALCHLGYGAGFLAGMADSLRRQRRASRSFTGLSR